MCASGRERDRVCGMELASDWTLNSANSANSGVDSAVSVADSTARARREPREPGVCYVCLEEVQGGNVRCNCDGLHDECLAKLVRSSNPTHCSVCRQRWRGVHATERRRCVLVPKSSAEQHMLLTILEVMALVGGVTELRLTAREDIASPAWYTTLVFGCVLFSVFLSVVFVHVASGCRARCVTVVTGVRVERV